MQNLNVFLFYRNKTLLGGNESEETNDSVCVQFGVTGASHWSQKPFLILNQGLTEVHRIFQQFSESM